MAKAKTKVRKKPVILPKKLSALIKIALKDLRKAEALPKKFIVEMDDWFVPEDVVCETKNGTEFERHKICTVCAAGSVMAFSLGMGEDKRFLAPEKFPRNEGQLHAINDLRCGEVDHAAFSLGLVAPDDYGDYDFNAFNKFNCVIPEYNRKNPEPFHKAMTKLQEKLVKAGL